MYLNEQIDKIIDILIEIKGYNQATQDVTAYEIKKTSQQVKPTSFNYDLEFIKQRFKNHPEEQRKRLDNYSKNKSSFEVKIDDLDDNQVIERDESMKGTVSQRKDGRYMGRFYFLGKRYHVYAKSKSQCWVELRKKRKELNEEFKEVDKVSKTMYLNTWFDYWVNTFKIQEVKESTFVGYLEIYDRYVRNSIGKERINNINSSKIQTFINSLPAYSAKKKLMQILRDLFDLLHKENYVSKNAMTMVVLPKKNKDDAPDVIDEEDSKILMYHDEQVILEKIKKSKCYDVVKFILYTGLRRGEAIGLTWKNVDLVNDKITISQQWNNETKKITSPKTKAAYRSIPLMQPAKDVLIELSKKPHKVEDYVFDGIKRLTQMLIYFSDKLKIDFNPHMLRHTFASRCYAAGVDPKVIQVILGHETIDTTLNTYTHVLTTEDSEVIKYIRNFFIAKGLIIVR